MNFALTIVFGWEVTRVAQSGIVLIIQFTLLGMTVVFAFGLWITCKRKFLLLKLYTIVLAAFVGVQIFAVIMLAMGSAETEDIANTVFEQARPALREPAARALLTLTRLRLRSCARQRRLRRMTRRRRSRRTRWRRTSTRRRGSAAAPRGAGPPPPGSCRARASR